MFRPRLTRAGAEKDTRHHWQTNRNVRFVSIFPLSFHSAPLSFSSFVCRLSFFILSYRAYHEREREVFSSDFSRILSQLFSRHLYLSFPFYLAVAAPLACMLIFLASKGRFEEDPRFPHWRFAIIYNKRLLSPRLSVDDFATGFIVITDNLFRDASDACFLSPLNLRWKPIRGFYSLVLNSRHCRGIKATTRERGCSVTWCGWRQRCKDSWNLFDQWLVFEDKGAFADPDRNFTNIIVRSR